MIDFFALKLIIHNRDKIENRVKDVLEYINTHNGTLDITISDFDSSGKLGILLTEKYNQLRNFKIDISDLFKVIEEDGQIFDLKADIQSKSNYYSIMIIRGQDVNILSNDFQILDYKFLGDFKHIDMDMF